MSSTFTFIVSPHGDLGLAQGRLDLPMTPATAERLAAAFLRGAGHGLLDLALGEWGEPLPADVAFWRGFATRFLAQRCGANGADIAPPSPQDLAQLAEQAPPMRRGEYLGAATLETLWRSLNGALEDERVASGLPLDEFLAARDSRWRSVGRVHFNLAENRKDAKRPFAFLATYFPGIAAHGAALREYAGASTKSELLRRD